MDATSQPHTDKLAEQPPISRAVVRAPSPVAIGSTLVNRQGSISTGYCESNYVPFRATQIAPNTSSTISRKRAAEPNKFPGEKRPKIATGSSYPTRQVPTLNQTPTSLRSLRVTKPVATQKDGAVPSLERICHVPGHRQHGTQIQEFTTTIEQLTPYPSRILQFSLDDSITATTHPSSYSQETVFESENGLEPHPIAESSIRMAPCSNGTTYSAKTSVIHTMIASDEYPLDEDLTDGDMAQLLAVSSGSINERHMPPSSVQGWDYESRSAAEYDTALKRSSPTLDLQEANANAAGIYHAAGKWQTDTPENLLDEDVDWNVVLAGSNAIQGTPLIDSCHEIEFSKRINVGMCKKISGDARPCPDEGESFPAFTRPSFPEKVRDRPSVPGMSSDILLRTCFRIGAMISQTMHSFSHKQNVVFELYARVTYSSRETLSRRQHFQFVDLFKDQQPYPAATLTNWRIDSQLDKDSATFLDTRGGPRLCWCMCKPMRDPKAVIGWTYTVLKIKEANWEQIRWAKRIICGDSEGLPSKLVTAKL